VDGNGSILRKAGGEGMEEGGKEITI